ncbi:MAG: hybrid sensor histidine kinase/response regulator [Bacteroidales bacterium]|nr:hybrid sensor histidine kinase/response regulator [Bacteroidales bacterium]
MKINSADYLIYVVDDVQTNILLLQTILQKEGFKIKSALSGEDALELVKTQKPDLILLDVMMPGMDGYTVAERLKNDPETENIPIIFLTALNETTDIVKGFKLGASDYLTKPFHKDELIVRITHQLTLLCATRIIKKQQSDLEQVIAARDKLYSIVSHDLRSPVSALKMLNSAILMLMKGSKEVTAEMIEIVELMNQSSDELYSLLDNLLKWTKNQLGTLKAVKQEVNVNNILTDILNVYTLFATQKEVKLKIDLLPEDLIFQGDIEMVKAILRNLISNALKFTFKGGTVELTTTKQTDGVLFKVKDTGKGIAEEDQKKLLQDNTHFTTYGTNKEKGSGLGLLLCRDFAQLHNGKLWFESEENVGTTFFCFLPYE